MYRNYLAHRRPADQRRPGPTDRRHFLTLAGTGLLGFWGSSLWAREPLLAQSSPSLRRPEKTQRVLVIGAGISGLAAARALADTATV